ncbi:DUF664 domain-containing protein [Streptomyces sp. I4(2020)]|nr:DUF664 domain-containing protein [Streptomyces sp. I3(2020)]MBJ6628115.1 DUF664 domain-containing protein [Streptomyces sp. I4(2020)]
MDELLGRRCRCGAGVPRRPGDGDHLCAGRPLDGTGRIADGPPAGTEVSPRRVLIHVIEEYARHNGHADLLRERIDGVTGA